ncbi:hypothetical protein L211DRAFT_835805 [Terfezia boudieri ATCC MYA-4762]|uniref:Uncharacterized protein n=1 Tax=Terfezia boudieri ATCC MYA-4762 TaxID=1051890 RepID=A0A3N4LS67_9PEZI|nr:hypothetical protein L211DRAFT_835805 [Terfezia boudieri ATCC MYA-4762]
MGCETDDYGNVNKETKADYLTKFLVQRKEKNDDAKEKTIEERKLNANVRKRTKKMCLAEKSSFIENATSG